MTRSSGRCWRERYRLLHTERSAGAERPTCPTCVLCYPDTYAAGMASLGFQVIHAAFSGTEAGWSVERAFGLGEPYQQCLLRQRGTAGTLETGAPLSAARVLAFSLPYSLLYRDAIALLEAGGVSTVAVDRAEDGPLVIAGGSAVTINPEPISPVVDLVVLGEAEPCLPYLIDLLHRWIGRDIRREALWEEASRIKGLYAPALMDAGEATRWDVPPIEHTATVSSFLTPASHFRDSLLVEVSRGCPGTCRFCAVGTLYQPVRWRPAKQVIQLVGQSALKPARVSLIGAAVSQHPEIVAVVRALSRAGQEVGLSSLRVDRYSPDLARGLHGSGARTVTMAPEAGSDRLRSLVGKPLKHRLLVRAVTEAGRAGANKIRLYFMIGLPWEEERDREGIVEVCAELSAVLRGTPSLLVPSLTPFVPKPMTPFAWCGPPREDELHEHIRRLLKELGAIPRVRPRAGSSRLAVADYRLSMGGRDLAAPLREMVRESLSWRDWLRATDGAIRHTPCFPWGPHEDALRREWERAVEQAKGSLHF